MAWIPRRRRPPRRSPPSSAILRLGVSFSPAAARLGRRRSRRRGVRTPADGAPIATTRSSQSPTSGNATECKSDAFEHSTIVDFEGLVRGEGALQGKYIHRNNKPIAPFTLNPPPNSAACVSHLVPITQRSAPSSKN